MITIKSLISINYKFMELTPKELVELILTSKHTKGIEICVDSNSEYELKYLNDLIFEVKRNDLELQVHGNSELPIPKQIAFLKQLENYSDYLGYPIVVTLHSLYNEDIELSIKNTTEYLESIINKIDHSKLIICLENLNDAPNLNRLEKEYITPLIINNERIYFTYDIGHEIADYAKITDLNTYMIEEIRNVHIHTSDLMGNDHYPIYKNTRNWNNIIKGLLFLINNKYKYSIVYEYNVYECHGDTIKEKVMDYLKSIDLVSEHYC